MKARFAATILSLCLCLAASAQSWVSSYQAGLDAAKLGHWHQARDDFKQAIANRTEDVSRPTTLHGVKWRNGSPYSPNFLAGYSEYRESLDVTDPDTQTSMMRLSAMELDTLLAKHQLSRDAYFFLQVIYTRLNDQGKLNDLVARLNRDANSLTWKVDEEVVAPEEVSAMSVPVPAPSVGPTTPAPQVPASEATTGTVGTQLNPIVPGLGIGNVQTVPDKFALVIGETSTQIPYAGQDAQVVRDALVKYGGYPQANVSALLDPTAAQIRDAAKGLAANVQQDGVVLLYFVGAGVDRSGKDFLLGSDGAQVSKSDLWTQFLIRGARVFTFFEVNRPIVGDSFFGEEVPTMGAISQMNATTPDSTIGAVYYDGKPVGLFALSFANVLGEMKSNRIPIYEFGWQVFNQMRRGNTGASSGASRQIPTLPVLNNLAADARF